MVGAREMGIVRPRRVGGADRLDGIAGLEVVLVDMPFERIAAGILAGRIRSADGLDVRSGTGRHVHHDSARVLRTVCLEHANGGVADLHAECHDARARDRRDGRIVALENDALRIAAQDQLHGHVLAAVRRAEPANALWEHVPVSDVRYHPDHSTIVVSLPVTMTAPQPTASPMRAAGWPSINVLLAP